MVERVSWSPGPLAPTWACLLLTGCGSVSFGEALGPSDAGPRLDLGPGVDGGPVDLGMDAGVDADVPPVMDGGCIEVPIPSEPASSWPFDRTTGAYSAVFWDAVGSGCSLSSCHGGGTYPPLVPQAANLDSQVDTAIDELWSRVISSGPLDAENPSGALWKHVRGHPEFAIPELTVVQRVTLQQLRVAAVDCARASVLESPPDAGPLCNMAETDAGPPDFGALDAGVGDASPDAALSDAALSDASGADAEADAGAAVDAGPPDSGASSGLCYCELPDLGPLNTEHCAP